jgi:hypothetical protein
MILLWFWLIPVWWGGTDLALLCLGRQPAGSDPGAHLAPTLASLGLRPRSRSPGRRIRTVHAGMIARRHLEK